MARKPRKLAVKYAARASAALSEIWDWNAERYGIPHADDYLAFLRAGADDLATEYPAGKSVPGRPGLLYVTIRKNPHGHGHVVVYSVGDDSVEIAYVFHTAQDWHRRLSVGTAEEGPS